MNKRSLSLILDKLGMCTSIICLAHCLAVPLLLLIGFDTLLQVVDTPWMEFAILSTALLIGLLSFYLGYIRHRQHHVPVLFTAGFLLVATAEANPQQWVSLCISLAGTLTLAYAHYQNLIWKRRVAPATHRPVSV